MYFLRTSYKARGKGVGEIPGQFWALSVAGLLGHWWRSWWRLLAEFVGLECALSCGTAPHD